MSTKPLKCDQVIFTSTRTPMGEGYRIIAASAGVRPEEKQVITRNSPSHDSLCSTAPDARGVAFYPLATGRLCAAVSCFAGNEHTGRGGQRIYTHNVVFSAQQFATHAFHPFAILRAMIDHGLTTPQLSPPQKLPELELAVSDDPNAEVPMPASALSAPARCYILHRLLDDGSLVLRLDADWPTTAEAFVLALPGPLRAKVPFSAGLRFSVGRVHRFQVISDEKGAARTKVTGQKMEYVEPNGSPPELRERTAWVSLVDRLWNRRDTRTLIDRASRPYADVSPAARERVGRLYNLIDEVDAVDPDKLLTRCGECFQADLSGIEGELRTTFMRAAQRSLIVRFAAMPWAQLKPLWTQVITLWRRSKENAQMIQPILQAMVFAAMKNDPIAVADAAIEIAGNIPPTADRTAHANMLDHLLNQLGTVVPVAAPADRERIARLCARWQTVRPSCPIVARLREQCRLCAARVASSV